MEKNFLQEDYPVEAQMMIACRCGPSALRALAVTCRQGNVIASCSRVWQQCLFPELARASQGIDCRKLYDCLRSQWLHVCQAEIEAFMLTPMPPRSDFNHPSFKSYLTGMTRVEIEGLIKECTVNKWWGVLELIPKEIDLDRVRRRHNPKPRY